MAYRDIETRRARDRARTAARSPEERAKVAAYQRAYRQANRERLLAQMKAYREAADPDRTRAEKAAWYAENRDAIRERAEQRNGLTRSERNRQNLYGLEPGEYERMVADQNGVCAGCGKPPPTEGHKSVTSLHVDHDHETGRVRGLLCMNCNRAIGMVYDNPDLLMAMAAYLLQSQDVLHMSDLGG